MAGVRHSSFRCAEESEGGAERVPQSGSYVKDGLLQSNCGTIP